VAWAAWAASGLATASFSTPPTTPDDALAVVLDPSTPSPQRLRPFSSPAIQGGEEQSSLPGGLRGVLHAARVKPHLPRRAGADAPYRTDTCRAAGRVRGKGGAFAGYEKEAAANAAGRSLVAAVSAQVTCLCPWCAFEVTPRRAPGRKPGASLYTRNRLSPHSSSASLYTTKRLSHLYIVICSYFQSY